MTDDELEAIRARKLAKLIERGKVRSNPPPAAPVDVTDGDFDAFLSEHPVVLVDFWAAWCAPCRMIAPAVEELAREYGDRLAVGKLNVDHNPVTAGRFGVMSIPTLILFRGGRPVERITGAVPKAVLERAVRKVLPAA
jgi:thioredoxin 1